MIQNSVLRCRYAFMAPINFLAWALLVALTASAVVAQEKTTPSRPRPAPQITGRFIDTDGARRLTVEYWHNSKLEAFTGTIQSACVVPAQSNPGESKPLDLSSIPLGTQMTVFYIRHAQTGKMSKQPVNVILALRFDRVSVRGSKLPEGVAIPCFKGSGQAKQ